MFEKFLSLKKESALNLLQRLFYIGIITLFFSSIWIGKYIAILFPSQYQVPAAEPGWYTFETGPNVLRGIFMGACLFIISIAIWKIICQILLIILEAFESYTHQKNLD
ncbi:hypothetical protein [Anaerosolibacter sp.]|uniref:hypothetical protein n=1 Tax=Anaerosolibacter sp. TaxID=1872527 RepID=UPI0039EF2180